MSQILNLYGINKNRTKIKKQLGDELFELFKAEYKDELRTQFSSVHGKRDLNRKYLSLYLNFILGLFAMEWGVYLRAPGEKENITLTEILND